MSLCPKCQKPVYFAERRTSLGKEWHRECLTCEECGRVLHPGQHAEHKGIPYCSVPCYSALFGPTMFGHGSTVEAHTNFGRQTSMKSSPLKRSELEARLQHYNELCGDSGTLRVKSREVNKRLILEGALAVYWGVVTPITFQQKDEERQQPKDKHDKWRKSYCMAIDNGLDEEFLQAIDNGGDTLRGHHNSLEDLREQPESGSGDSRPRRTETSRDSVVSKYNTIAFRGERKRKKVTRRWSMINGHVFDVETSTFTPAHGSMTNVTITSLDPAPEVIKMLLEKFKVLNDPDDFCLCSVKKSGETYILGLNDCPLLERVMMGPVEDECKIFIMEKKRVHTISSEVAQFVILPEAVLQGFLQKLREEEEEQVTIAKERYLKYRAELQRRLSEISTQM